MKEEYLAQEESRGVGAPGEREMKKARFKDGSRTMRKSGIPSHRSRRLHIICSVTFKGSLYESRVKKSGGGIKRKILNYQKIKMQ